MGTDDNMGTLTPIGDRFDKNVDAKRVAPDPPPSPKAKFNYVNPVESPTNEITDALRNANPKELAKALDDVRKSSKQTKQNVEKMVDRMIKAEGIDMNEPGENITLPTITTTTPSPIDIQTTTVIPPQEKGKETGKRKKEKKKKDKKKKRGRRSN